MTVENNARFGDSSVTHLSPKLIPFFLGGIQSQFAVDLLLFFFGPVLEILAYRKIDRLVRPLLYERCGQISTTPPASTTSPSVPAALPSFVVRATCRRPVLVLRSASSASWVWTKASASASREGLSGLGHSRLWMWRRTRVVGGNGPGALGGKACRRPRSGFGRCVHWDFPKIK